MMRSGKCYALVVALPVIACMGGDIETQREVPPAGVVTANSIEFEYFIEGNGVPCMVVGDALTPSRALSANLREHFQFIFVNSRMTTEEAKVGDVNSVTMDTLTSDIEAVRESLGLGQVCVFGHSISGILALEYARKYPDSIRCVIMHASPPHERQSFHGDRAAFWEEHASDERKAKMEANWAALGDDPFSGLSSSDAGIQEYATNAPRYFYDPDYDPSWLLEGAYWNSGAWDRLIAFAADYDIGVGTPVQTPVFLALGREDYGVPFTLWDSERSKIPNLSYHLFDRSAHYPMLEEQELFDRTLTEWIQNH